MKPRYLSSQTIARKAAELVAAHRRTNPSFGLPYALDELIWDHLNVVDQLGFDDETPLGVDPETGEPILGKTVLDQRMIFIDPSVKGKPYYRFTVAHEIGHWVLHCRPQLAGRPLAAVATGTGTRARTAAALPRQLVTYPRAITEPTSGRLDAFEVQANRFAACLLMPETELRASFRERFGEALSVNGELREFSRRIARQRVRRLASLVELFDTSVETMAIRLESLGLVTTPE